MHDYLSLQQLAAAGAAVEKKKLNKGQANHGAYTYRKQGEKRPGLVEKLTANKREVRILARWAEQCGLPFTKPPFPTVYDLAENNRNTSVLMHYFAPLQPKLQPFGSELADRIAEAMLKASRSLSDVVNYRYPRKDFAIGLKKAYAKRLGVPAKAIGAGAGCYAALRGIDRIRLAWQSGNTSKARDEFPTFLCILQAIFTESQDLCAHQDE